MKKFLTAVALLAISFSASAQGGAFDVFGGLRTLVLASSTPNNNNGAGAALTNNWADIRLFHGIAKIDFFAQTNGAGSMTATLQTSADQTNFSTISPYALASVKSITETNFYYGTNLTATDTWLLPGTYTTPTAYTAGFATPYILPAPFTNTGVITLPGNQLVSIGVNVDDMQRYLRVVWTPTGTVSNWCTCAIMTGKTTGLP